MTCEHCTEPIPDGKRSDARFCSKACRSRAAVIRNNPVRRARYATDSDYRSRAKTASRDARRLLVTPV